MLEAVLSEELPDEPYAGSLRHTSKNRPGSGAPALQQVQYQQSRHNLRSAGAQRAALAMNLDMIIYVRMRKLELSCQIINYLCFLGRCMVLIPERERICKLSRHLETVETGTDLFFLALFKGSAAFRDCRTFSSGILQFGRTCTTARW